MRYNYVFVIPCARTQGKYDLYHFLRHSHTMVVRRCVRSSVCERRPNCHFCLSGDVRDVWPKLGCWDIFAHRTVASANEIAALSWILRSVASGCSACVPTQIQRYSIHSQKNRKQLLAKTTMLIFQHFDADNIQTESSPSKCAHFVGIQPNQTHEPLRQTV